jgi:hypothetical protein
LRRSAIGKHFFYLSVTAKKSEKFDPDTFCGAARDISPVAIPFLEFRMPVRIPRSKKTTTF